MKIDALHNRSRTLRYRRARDRASQRTVRRLCCATRARPLLARGSARDARRWSRWTSRRSLAFSRSDHGLSAAFGTENSGGRTDTTFQVIAPLSQHRFIPHACGIKPQACRDDGTCVLVVGPMTGSPQDSVLTVIDTNSAAVIARSSYETSVVGADPIAELTARGDGIVWSHNSSSASD